jgi:transglutaminase-like putative cysteine protease
MSERSGGRLSWVENGLDVPAAPLTWTVAVLTCALATWGFIPEPAQAAGSALVLVVGAATGRLLRLDQLFRSTGAWMVAIAVATVAFLAGAVFDTTPVGLFVGLFVLPLDWRVIPRLRAAVGAGMVFAALAVVGPGSLRLPVLALWAPLAALTLLLVERDVRRAGRQAARHRPPGLPPVPPDTTRTARDALACAVMAVVAVIAALVVLPAPSPAPSPGKAGESGLDTAAYDGFAGSLDLAGQPPRGDAVVARVRADTPALWRGDSYDRFDGRTWTQRTAAVEPLGHRERVAVPDPVEPDVGVRAPQAGSGPPVPPVATTTQVQVFTFERGGDDLVFGANRPKTILTSGSASWYPASDAVRLDRPLGRGGSYTVVSERPRLTDDLLRSLDAAQQDAMVLSAQATARDPRRTRDPFDRYLAVPPSTSARTRELAASATAGAATTLDRIRALETWLGANTRYRLDLPPLPPGADAVDRFLFETRLGFCQQIASALTVMLRTLGVPARLAVGYVPDGQDAVSGEWIVREHNAHAWVEVWWPGVGWQGFDPTAEVPLAPDQGASTPTDRLGSLVPLAGSALAVLALVAGGLVVAERWRRRPRPRSWVDVAVGRFDAVGALVDQPRAPDETLVEHGDALDRGALAGAGAPPLGRALSAAVFAPSPSTTGPAAQAAADEALAGLEQAAAARRAAGRRGRWPGRSRPPREPVSSAGSG